LECWGVDRDDLLDRDRATVVDILSGNEFVPILNSGLPAIIVAKTPEAGRVAGANDIADIMRATAAGLDSSPARIRARARFVNEERQRIGRVDSILLAHLNPDL